ncbi:MAG: hypothetical protein WAK48_02000 [Candidatus Acidiferrum sp.]|jgi:hypothetical protein
MNIIQALKKEHARLERNLERVAAAIAVLGGRRKRRKTGKMSAEVRKRISATQKANWRKKRAGK